MPGFPAARPFSMPLNPLDPRVNMNGWSWSAASSSQTVARTSRKVRCRSLGGGLEGRTTCLPVARGTRSALSFTLVTVIAHPISEEDQSSATTNRRSYYHP